ncbi:MAG: hypothetical protein RIQ81_847 [Pseudomonadota bacterium]
MSENQVPNLPFPPGNVVIPAWLAASLACVPGHAEILSPYACGLAPVGLSQTELQLLPWVIGTWARDPSSPEQFHLDLASLRSILPDELRDVAGDFCAHAFGLRLMSREGHAGSLEAQPVQPFFTGEILLKRTQSIGSGYCARLVAGNGMDRILLGGAGVEHPALTFPAALWRELGAAERSWLLVLEASARWQFNWVRLDGCVQMDLPLQSGQSLPGVLKCLAGLGRSLIRHGVITSSVDDGAVLFHPRAGGSAPCLRVLWTMHPSRAGQIPGEIESQRAQAPTTIPPVLSVPVIASDVGVEASLPEQANGTLHAKMRLVAADELKKMRAGGSGQYHRLKQKYFESLDPAGRSMIRDMQQRLAPEVFDTHLGHVLVRFMIEHPSSWQSAASGKSAH